MDFNPEVNHWIKSRFREVPISGPESSRIKFSDILEEVQHAFPTSNVSSFVVSNATSKEFPMSVGKKVGEKKHKYIYGIEINWEAGGSSTDHLAARVMALEQTLEYEQETKECLLQQLQQQVEELKHQQQTSFSIQRLDDQMQRPSMCSFHGPDTVDHFNSFSLDTVIAELHLMWRCSRSWQRVKGLKMMNYHEQFKWGQRQHCAHCSRATQLSTRHSTSLFFYAHWTGYYQTYNIINPLRMRSRVTVVCLFVCLLPL